MRPKDIQRAAELRKILDSNVAWLPGVSSSSARTVLIEQIIESLRRVEYIKFILARDVDPACADPHNIRFDAYKAAVYHIRGGREEEAFWLVFLATLIGKHRRQGWITVRAIYGALDTKPIWRWSRVAKDPEGFRDWLEANQSGIPRFVGNHRKYLSLDAGKDAGVGAAVVTYVNWIRSAGSHKALIAAHMAQSDNNRRAAFYSLFRSMEVASFGRTARFDYLAMLSKLELAPIDADSPYMQGATGPYQGAQRLFGPKGASDRGQGNALTIKLADKLEVGLDVIEDALCNWQKSTNKFIPFRG